MCVSVYKHFRWFLPFFILTFDSKRPQKQAEDFSWAQVVPSMVPVQTEACLADVEEGHVLCLLSRFTTGC